MKKNLLIFVVFVGFSLGFANANDNEKHAILLGCQKHDNILGRYFNKSEIQNIEQIIDYFDAYVLTHTGNQLPIDKAYHAYFDEIRTEVKQVSDLNKYLPAIEERIGFYKTLDQNVLADIYTIRDTLKIKYRGESEARTLYRPYSFELNVHGKYFAFLKELSKRNDFFRDYYETIEVGGDIAPSTYPKMFQYHDQIDFSKPEERLVVIVTILCIGAPVHFDDKNLCYIVVW